MSEEKKEPVPSSTKVMIKNISKRVINLANGAVKEGAEGVATLAEVQCYGKFIEEIDGEVPLDEAEKKAVKRAESLAKRREATSSKPIAPIKAG